MLKAHKKKKKKTEELTPYNPDERESRKCPVMMHPKKKLTHTDPIYLCHMYIPLPNANIMIPNPRTHMRMSKTINKPSFTDNDFASLLRCPLDLCQISLGKKSLTSHSTFSTCAAAEIP